MTIAFRRPLFAARLAFALALTLAAAVQSLTGALAHGVKVGDLAIDHPWTRATPPGAPVSGGYMVIRNTGKEADRLIGGSAPFAGKLEIHEMAMDGDVMKMRQLADGLEIPAGGEVVLKPGGYHVMFIQMKQQLNKGESQKVMLRFEKAGEIEMDFDVQDPAQLQMQM